MKFICSIGKCRHKKVQFETWQELWKHLNIDYRPLGHAREYIVVKDRMSKIRHPAQVPKALAS